MARKQGDDNAPDRNARLLPGRDARLEQLGQRAEAAGLNAWWTQFRNPATGQWEGPYGMRVNLRSGRGFRSVNLMGGDEAAVLLQFPFEQWTVLQGYQAILDPNGQRIVAAVTLRGTTLSNIPGVVIRPPEEEPNEEPVSGSVAELRAEFRLSGPQLGLRSLTIASADGDLAVELHSQAPAEIEALRGSSNRIGQAMVIRGVATHRHDEAHALLEDLAAAVFIELDRSYGLAGTLSRATGDDPIQQEYDEEPISSLPPRLPSARYGRDAASLYLYARTVSFQLPLLEFLGYYQVIEHYMAAFSRAMTIKRVSNMLKDPRFDHNDDVAVDRLIDAALPAGHSRTTEREQVLAAVEACLDDNTITTFLDERPAAAKALSDKKWITGVRAITPGDSQASLVRQIADRIYGIRCRIVHSKDNHGEAEPLHPFGPEAKRLRHDLNLIRFVAQHVLIAASKPATWR